MFKSSGGWYLSSDANQTIKYELDQDGLWLHANPKDVRSDVLTTIAFASGTGNASGVVATASMTAFAGKTPVPVTDASKTLSALGAGLQEYLDVQWYPLGQIGLTLASLPGGTTVIPKVMQ